jgi:hypothetical protein
MLLACSNFTAQNRVYYTLATQGIAVIATVYGGNSGIQPCSKQSSGVVGIFFDSVQILKYQRTKGLSARHRLSSGAIACCRVCNAVECCIIPRTGAAGTFSGCSANKTHHDARAIIFPQHDHQRSAPASSRCSRAGEGWCRRGQRVRGEAGMTIQTCERQGGGEEE